MNINKKNILKSLLKETKGISWPKEMRVLKVLTSIFPDETFWNSLKLDFKLNSACWLLSDDGRKFLNTEYKKYKFTPKESIIFDISKDCLENKQVNPTKNEENLTKKTLKSFLDLW